MIRSEGPSKVPSIRSKPTLVLHLSSGHLNLRMDFTVEEVCVLHLDDVTMSPIEWVSNSSSHIPTWMSPSLLAILVTLVACSS